MSTINVALLQMSSCGTDLEFDIDRIREYRSREVWGNALTLPPKYKTHPELRFRAVLTGGASEVELALV
jgi:hypothetical protein